MNMKSQRSYIHLSVVLIVMALALYANKHRGGRVNDSSSDAIVKGFDTKDIERVVIEQLLDGVQIKRVGDGWQVAMLITDTKKKLLDKENGQPQPERWFTADAERIDNALGSFGGLTKGVLVSTNKDKQALFQVNAMGLKVSGIAEDEKRAFDIIIGKNGPDLASSYVRNADDDKVYLINKSLLGVFSPKVEDWRAKEIFGIDPNDIISVTISGAKLSGELSKDEKGEWKTSSGELKLKSADIQKVVGELARARAAGFADDSTITEAGLSTPDLKLEFVLAKDGAKRTLAIGKSNSSGQRFASVDGGDDIYLLSKELSDELIKKFSSK